MEIKTVPTNEFWASMIKSIGKNIIDLQESLAKLGYSPKDVFDNPHVNELIKLLAEAYGMGTTTQIIMTREEAEELNTL